MTAIFVLQPIKEYHNEIWILSLYLLTHKTFGSFYQVAKASFRLGKSTEPSGCHRLLVHNCSSLLLHDTHTKYYDNPSAGSKLLGDRHREMKCIICIFFSFIYSYMYSMYTYTVYVKESVSLFFIYFHMVAPVSIPNLSWWQRTFLKKF